MPLHSVCCWAAQLITDVIELLLHVVCCALISIAIGFCLLMEDTVLCTQKLSAALSTRSVSVTLSPSQCPRLPRHLCVDHSTLLLHSSGQDPLATTMDFCKRRVLWSTSRGDGKLGESFTDANRLGAWSEHSSSHVALAILLLCSDGRAPLTTRSAFVALSPQLAFAEPSGH